MIKKLPLLFFLTTLLMGCIYYNVPDGPPEVVLTAKEVHSWEGKTFGELKARFGTKGARTKQPGYWIYRPSRFNTVVGPAPIAVIDEFSDKQYLSVTFYGRAPITSDTKITSVSYNNNW
jgi:hypothetical protein